MITRRMVFLLAFYDAFYISPANAKRAAAMEAVTASKHRGSAVSPGSSASSGVGDMTTVGGSSGGAVASPDRRRSLQKPLWEGA